LDLVAQADEPPGISAIARCLGLPKSSVANLCAALVDDQMLRNVPGGYSLGPRLARLGAAYLTSVDQVGLFLEACAERDVSTRETAQLAQLGAGLDVVYLARRDGTEPVRLASSPGRALPANCTATGKAMLATLDPTDLAARLDGVRDLPRLTPHSIATRRALARELEAIRSEGVAYDRQEVIEGVVCVAVAVPSPADDAPMAASFTLLAPRADEVTLARLAGDLREIAEHLAIGLGLATTVGAGVGTNGRGAT
jgi:DNA-binding IclR family transcriptional regulator